MAANKIDNWPGHNWYASLLNQLIYDCDGDVADDYEYEYEYELDEKFRDCLKESATLRELMLPTVKAILEDMYKKTIDYFLPRQNNLVKDIICSLIDDKNPWTYILINSDSETHREKNKRLIDILAQNFRQGINIFKDDDQMFLKVLGGTNFTEELGRDAFNWLQRFSSYQECLKGYDEYLEEAKASFVFFCKYIIENGNSFSLPRFLIEVVGLDNYDYIEEGSKLDDFISGVKDSINYLTKKQQFRRGKCLKLL